MFFEIIMVEDGYLHTIVPSVMRGFSIQKLRGIDLGFIVIGVVMVRKLLFF